MRVHPHLSFMLREKYATYIRLDYTQTKITPTSAPREQLMNMVVCWDVAVFLQSLLRPK